MFSGLVINLFILLLGLVLCFAGYRLFMAMLPALGFLSGFWLGAEGFALFSGSGFLTTPGSWAAAVIGGLALALLAHFFYFLGVAIVTAAFGFILGSSLTQALGFRAANQVLLGSVLCAVIVMALAQMLNLQKYILIAITAIGGANILFLSTLLFVGRTSLTALRTDAAHLTLRGPWLIGWLVLAVAGFIVQAQTHRGYTRPPRMQRPEPPPKQT